MQSHEVVHVHSRSLLCRSLLLKYVPHPRSLKGWDSAGRFAGGLWRDPSESLPEVVWNSKREWSFAARRGSRSSDGKEGQRLGGH